MYYGFDMGGTKIELAVFDKDLTQIWQKRVPTPKNDYQALLNVFKELTLEADNEIGYKGKVGVGVPGIVNAKEGTVFTTNVPAAKYKPMIHDLAHILNRPVKVENDANCFALSEAWDPEFRHHPSVLGLILGTGVGGGFVIDGKVLSGKNGIAGEIGHMNLNVDADNVIGETMPKIICGCGKKACFETYLSGRGFERMYKAFNDAPQRAVDIVEQYYAGDKKTQEHVDRYMKVLAIYLSNILTVLDPHLIVIGGGLSQFNALYELLPEYLSHCVYGNAQIPLIEKARHGDAGGARGAACLNLLD
ncbi:N-acetylglucosamine kinase [Proteus faecis]|uniref:N-acetylglucosamine kinase n=1 Tax=Proteus faecis TaxID=2050967 RepID=UPI003075C3E1